MSADLPADPAPDPVAEALRMRASDADREKVASVLREAYAEGRLTAVEHGERLEEAYRAQTYGDLIPVLRDLPVPPGTLALPGANGLTPVTSPNAPAVAGVRPELAGQADPSMVAVFGAFERKGSWTVPPESTAVCVFGGGELDLTEATLTAQQSVITATCLFGGLEITVPHGMVVRSEAIGILGGVELPNDTVEPGSPVLVIKGVAIFGGIQVRRPKARGRGWVTGR